MAGSSVRAKLGLRHSHSILAVGLFAIRAPALWETMMSTLSTILTAKLVCVSLTCNV